MKRLLFAIILFMAQSLVWAESDYYDLEEYDYLYRSASEKKGKWIVVSVAGFVYGGHVLVGSPENGSGLLGIYCYDDAKNGLGFKMHLNTKNRPRGWDFGELVTVAYRFDHKDRKIGNWEPDVHDDHFRAVTSDLETIRYFLDNLKTSNVLTFAIGGATEFLYIRELGRIHDALRDFKDRCSELRYSDDMYEAVIDRSFLEKVYMFFDSF